MSVKRKSVGGGTDPALKAEDEKLIVGDAPAARPARKPARPARVDEREWKFFNTYLPETLLREFKAGCALQGLEIREGVAEAVTLWLAERASMQARQRAGKSAS